MFLDRDGLINRRPPVGTYVTRIEEFEILQGVPEAIRRLNDAGFPVFVVTNQRGLALRAMSGATVRRIHAELERALRRTGARLAGIYVCPHDVDAGCDCRKPQPGLLLRAAAKHGIDLRRSWMIGDSESDVLAGKRARCRTIRAGGDGGPAEAEAVPDFVAANLPQAVDLITTTLTEAGGAPPACMRAEGPGGH